MRQFVGATLLAEDDDRPELDEDEFYSRDLVGMKVLLKVYCVFASCIYIENVKSLWSKSVILYRRRVNLLELLLIFSTMEEMIFYTFCLTHPWKSATGVQRPISLCGYLL